MKIYFHRQETKVSLAGNKSFTSGKQKQYSQQIKEKAHYLVGESTIYLYLCLTIIIN